MATPAWCPGCAFNHDSTILATTSYDNTVRLWALHSIDGLPVTALAFDSPLSTVAWRAGTNELVAVGARGIFWLRYLHDGPAT
jgi:WD40 repeat protein